MLKKTILLEDIKIYDLENKFGVTGYNIADLLNMPYYWAGWNQNPHNDMNYYKIALDTAKNNPETILGKYYSLRTDDEVIPNLKRVSDTVDEYINENNILKMDIISKIIDSKTLTVHLRSGDFGIVSQSYLNVIKKMSAKFDNVIILSGVNRNINTNDNSNHNNNSKQSLLLSYKQILSINNNINIYIDIPDIHISIMRLASNLLIHRGGFSVLGSFINNNNIYYTNELPTINDEKWKKEMTNKNITFLSD